LFSHNTGDDHQNHSDDKPEGVIKLALRMMSHASAFVQYF